jgi:hypothetical protein
VGEVLLDNVSKAVIAPSELTEEIASVIVSVGDVGAL